MLRRYLSRAGKWIDVFNFDQKDIDPQDFVSAAYQNRAFGHWGAYSVMQHQYHVGLHIRDVLKLSPSVVLTGMTHDMGEVYTADLITHIRKNPALHTYDGTIVNVQEQVYYWFGTNLAHKIYEPVRVADCAMLRAELETFNPHWLPFTKSHPRDPEVAYVNKYPAGAKPAVMTPAAAFDAYVDLYREMWQLAVADDLASGLEPAVCRIQPLHLLMRFE